MTERILARPARVASLAPRDLADARRLLTLVPAGADAVEFRLDLAVQPVAPAALLDLTSRPVIVTYRTRAEGGRFPGGREEYATAVTAAYEAGATVDVEHSSGLLSDSSRLPDRQRVIVSHHSPFSLPQDWEERIAAMHAANARVVKFVAGAADLTTSLQIAAAQKTLDPSVTFFPMGPAAAPGRILSALFGGSLVYGPVERATAAGQVPLADLLDIYEVDRPRSIEALFGIVGGDVSGSLSPRVHNALFGSRSLPHLYLPLPVADFERTKPVELEFEPPFRGFSVTRPWKIRAAASGVPDADVAATGAANTLWLERRSWRCANTDVDAVFDSLADYDTGEGRTAVVLGAGGVARAAVVAARKIGYEVLVASRRNERADGLAAELRVDSLAWSDVGATEADLYVNATPVGSAAGDLSAVPESVLAHRPLVFDCAYRPDGSETATIAAARAARCPVIDGLAMFAAQAARQARLFGVVEATAEEVSGLLSPRRAA